MKSFVTILIAALSLMPAPASGAPELDFVELAGFVEKTKQATGHPSGTAIAIVSDGKVVYEGYFGFADIGARTPVTRDTAFYIASTTKPFFALNVLLNEAKGRLDTRTSLRDMFPDAGFRDFDAGSVSLKDLLVHTSGVDNQPLVWATAFSGVHDARTRHALVAASHPHAEAPRGTFKYTNVGYNIASVWLDRTLARPWQDQLDDNIFEPLGMTRTSAYISEAEANGWPLAKPYSFAGANPGDPLYLRKSDDTMQAAGGLVSTAPDLAKFLIAQLGEGRHRGRQALPADVIARSHVPQATLDDRYLDFQRTGYAWGWYTGEYKGQAMLHHFGSFAGFHAHLSFMPDQNIGLVVLNNEDMLGARLTNLIADHVYGVLLGEAGVDERMAGLFEALVTQAGDARAAIAKHRTDIRGRASKLSRPLEAYVGTYTNALLGRMTVELDVDGELVIRWGRLAAVATGYDRADHVRVEFSPNSGNVLAFVLQDGGVDALSFENATFTRTR